MEVSLRFGHGTALTAHRAVIHSRAAASLPCTPLPYGCSRNCSTPTTSAVAEPLRFESPLCTNRRRVCKIALRASVSNLTSAYFFGSRLCTCILLSEIRGHTIELYIFSRKREQRSLKFCFAILAYEIRYQRVVTNLSHPHSTWHRGGGSKGEGIKDPPHPGRFRFPR